MANLVLGASFDGLWPPDALSGGIISLRQSGKMVYVSDAGFTVTLLGKGLAYDDDGWPSAGTLTGLSVEKDGITYATFSAISVNFARAGLLLFGFEGQNGFRDPDPYVLIQNALRGNDLVTGSAEWDDIRAGAGNDIINAQGGNDYVADQAGRDTMDGGDGWDTLSYDEANWSWDSFRGIWLDAAAGVTTDPWGFTDSFQNFEQFKDTHYNDTMFGSDHDENFFVNRGNDVIDGRGGFDWVIYGDSHIWGGTRGVRIDMTTGFVRDPWKGSDQLVGIEAVKGTRQADRFIGSAGDDGFLGDQGVDEANGGGGIDRLFFWDVGYDNDGGHGVVVDLSLAMEVTDDGYGNAENADSFEIVIGSQFGDRITGNSADNEIWAQDGNDSLSGGGGNDHIGGQWGRDTLAGGAGDDWLYGGGDDDTLTGNSGADDFIFDWDLVDMGVDRITDFAPGFDQIWVGSWWGGGFTAEDLVANQFRSGAGVTTANSATQRFVYNTTTGDLFFDADGSGSGATAVRFATLANQAALSFTDIHIIF